MTAAHWQYCWFVKRGTSTCYIVKLTKMISVWPTSCIRLIGWYNYIRSNILSEFPAKSFTYMFAEHVWYKWMISQNNTKLLVKRDLHILEEMESYFWQQGNKLFSSSLEIRMEKDSSPAHSTSLSYIMNWKKTCTLWSWVQSSWWLSAIVCVHQFTCSNTKCHMLIHVCSSIDCQRR